MKRYHQLIHHKGNDSLFKMLDLAILSLLNETPIHIHVTGLRGTGKTTVIRSVKEFLPPIRRIRGCVFNCLPGNPHCPLHRDMPPYEIEKIGTELVPMPFIEISHSAKLGTVVGSIDLEKITNAGSPEAAILPGAIPRAHRGILFVDEINRLADTAPELADVLLDVMGTKPGRIQIEETGLKTLEFPVCISVWAASNPDEEPGALEDIRKQLSDRFDYVVSVERPGEKEILEQILKQGIENTASVYPSTLYGKAISFLQKAKTIIDVKIPENILSFLTSVYIDHGIESIRGIESVVLGSRLHCAFQGRNEVDSSDVSFITPLALKHRVSPGQLADILKKVDELAHSRQLPENAAAETETNALPKDKRNIEQKNEKSSRNTMSKISEYLSRWFSLKPGHKEMNNGHIRKSKGSGSGQVSSLDSAGAGSVESNPNNLALTAPPHRAVLIRDHPQDSIVKTYAGDKN